MESSIILAKIFGLYFGIMGVFMLTHRKRLLAMVDDYADSFGMTLNGGIMALFSGIIILVFHNIWVADWPVLMTIVGWIALLKGIIFLWYPKAIHSMKALYSNRGAYYIVIAFVFFFAIEFLYFGFFV